MNLHASRPDGMHTKDFLAEVLRSVGLDKMAGQAATGYYHDYLSPLDMPETQLLIDLKQAISCETDQSKADRIQAVVNRHMNGDFDATYEESEAWAASREGQDALGSLLGGKK
jgi:hypothetical protein